ncbi:MULTISPECIES: hypothetical protein [Natrialbaceae]|uniref:hypothetical protein n=1 Tax=Natrialbaceae TaxID=1644061 RepID=UPI00207D0CD8|nr:hypothetical protein [Natronococcus sp. CG52]
MKELTRDFNEPEEDLFFTQLVISAIDDSWTSLETIQQGVWEAAQAYEEELKTEIDTNSFAFLNDLTTYDESTKEYIYNEAAARILSGRFNNRWSTRLQLPTDGIVNVRLDAELDSLSDEKRASSPRSIHRRNDTSRHSPKKSMESDITSTNWLTTGCW